MRRTLGVVAPHLPLPRRSAPALLRLSCAAALALGPTACAATPEAQPPTVSLMSPGAPTPSAPAAAPPEERPGELPPLPPPDHAPAPHTESSTGRADTPAASPARLAFVARSATVRLDPAPGGTPKPGDDAVVMLRLGPPSCAPPAKGERVFQVRLAWRVGNTNTFVQYVSHNGEAELNKGSIEVLAAPAATGSLGRIRVREGDDLNVSGGEIDALLCP